MTRLLAVALAVVLAAPAHAHADDDEEPVLVQRMRFAERGDALIVSANLTRIFDSEAYEALDNGFPATVVIRMWVYREGGSPIAAQLLSRRVVFDVWDEVYDVRQDGPGGRVSKKVKFRAEALKLLTDLDGVEIARKAQIPYQDNFVLAIEAELNPISAETMAEVRRWLYQGTGSGLDRGGSLFGSFVSVFVNPQFAAADRVIRVQSQPFYRPRP